MLEDIRKRLTDNNKIVYCIIGKEIAPTTNTPHL